MPVYADIPKWQVQEAAIRAVGQANLKAREKMAKAMEPKLAASVEPEKREAMRLAARSEALLLDPVYTGKAMAGLEAAIRSGRVSGRSARPRPINSSAPNPSWS